FADRTVGEGFRSYVTDTSPGRHSRETGVCDDGDLLSPGQVLQGGGDLVNLFHSRTHGSPANEDDDVARPDSIITPGFDGRDHGTFSRKDAGRSGVPIYAILIDHRRVDGCALNDRAFRSKVAAREGDGACQAHFFRFCWRHNDCVRVDSVLLVEPI